jgi:hypothetical protein
MSRSRRQAFIGRFEKAVSTARLKGYLANTSGERWEEIANYAWNVSLCEAFYPLLHAIEIVLRNSLDAAISARFPPRNYPNVRSWLDSTPSLLSQHASTDVLRAKKKLFSFDERTQSFVARGRPIEHGDLVAALDFGFWTGLLHRRYTYQSANDQRLWPHLLGIVFPYAPQAALPNVPAASNKFNEVRHFRNRVFHHEPIWKRNLADDRQEILNLIAWMSPEVAKTAAAIDRVHVVLAPEFRRELRVRAYQEVSS